MPADSFDIIFRGQLIEGQDPARVRQKVGKMFKASAEQVERLFSGKPVAIKKAVDMEAASRYRLAFRQAGALVEIRASQSAPPTEARPRTSMPAPGAQPADGMTLSPANSGSLEDYAPRLRPPPLPDISALNLAAPGTDHEPARDAPPPAIDTDALQLVPGQDWSLEDCQPPPLPQVEPDIDDLGLAALDDTSHIPPEPPPLPLPNIDDLDLASPEDTSHIPPDPPPAPLPDIAQLGLEPAALEPDDKTPE